MRHYLCTTCLAAGLIAGTAGAAAAQDYDENPFAGVYVGALIGYDDYDLDNESDLPDYFDDDDGNPGFITGLGSDGIAGGVVLGYNAPLGDRMIIGIEGAGRFSDASGDTSISDETSGDTMFETGTRSGWSVTGRIGFLVTDSTMIYGSGGWGQTRFNTRFINTPPGGMPTEEFDDGITRDAWRIGGGVEAALGGGWAARLDYTYANYESYDVVIDPANGFTVEPETHQVSLGVSKYF